MNAREVPTTMEDRKEHKGEASLRETVNRTNLRRSKSYHRRPCAERIPSTNSRADNLAESFITSVSREAAADSNAQGETHHPIQEGV